MGYLVALGEVIPPVQSLGLFYLFIFFYSNQLVDSAKNLRHMIV
jgi:hypothetical protein